MIPVGRLRQLGLSDDDIGYWRDVVSSLGTDERRELLTGWERATDSELIAETTLALTGVPGPVAEQAPDEPEGYTLDDVPAGNVDDVLGWITEGNDSDDWRARAAVALEIEEARDRPRSGVTEPARDILRG